MEAPPKGIPNSKQFKQAISQDNHWEGLTRFVENPLIPMDNNLAGQALRMPVAGRRSFYGSAPPEDISSFLPWAMDEERMRYF